jgi:hypothetical protein
MTTGSVSSARVSDAQSRPPLPKVGFGRLSAKNQFVHGGADHVAEEAQPEHAEHDARHAGEVVDGDAHGADDRAALGVLAQVQRRHDAERHHGQGHDQRHDDRAEDGREDAALAVGLARVVGRNSRQREA